MKVSVSTKIFIPFIILIIITFLLIIGMGYKVSNNIKNKIFYKTTQYLKTIFLEKYEEKKSVGITNAIAIATNNTIQKALKENNRTLAYNQLKNVSNYYKEFTKFKNIKIHVHDNELHSFLRVWINRYGDYLGGFRKTLVWVKRHKQPLVALEIGRAGLLLRGISPILDKGVFYLGSVEFIQGLNSIAKDFAKEDKYFVAVMKKKYLNIATFLKNADILSDYVISLKKGVYNKSFVKAIANVKFNNNIYFGKEYFAIKIPLKDFRGEIIGYAFVGEKTFKIKEIIENEMSLLKKEIIFLLALYMLLLYIMTFVISKVVLKPLKEMKNGLESFFDFLKNPKKDITLVDIKSDDEFGEMAKFINDGIKFASNLHSELIEYIRIIDENVLISKIGKNGNILEITSAFSKVSDFAKDEIVGKKFYELIINEKDKKYFIEKLKKEEPYKKEIKIKTKNGFFWMLMVFSKKCYSSIEECEFLVLGYDITDKKMVEELSDNLEKKVIERTQHLIEAKKEIENLHKNTKESIEFASLIQKVFIEDEKELNKYFKDAFVIWKPRDIVGGDIYSFEKRNENECLLMVIDCTGHGVPGAFVTMIVKSIEREIMLRFEDEKSFEISPAMILKYFNNTIKQLLKQNDKSTLSNVGFDGGVIYYNKRNQILKFSGANTPLFMLKKEDNEVIEIKGSKYSVGYKTCKFDYNYKEHQINVKEGDRFYISTDGYFDQLGGKKGFCFGKKRFKKLLEQKLSLNEQKNLILESLFEYMKEGEEEQNDDITIIGVEIDKRSNI